MLVVANNFNIYCVKYMEKILFQFSKRCYFLKVRTSV
jgi:hypothetical protein